MAITTTIPSQRYTMTSEVGATGLEVWGGRISERYLADLQHDKGIDTFVEMCRREPAVRVVLAALGLSFGRAEWRVEPGGDTPADEQAAAHLESCMGDMSHSWTGFVESLAWSDLVGFDLKEICWKSRRGDQPEGGKAAASLYDDGHIGWRKFAPRRQETVNQWLLDDEGGLQGIEQVAAPSYNAVNIPISKLLLFTSGLSRGDPEGLGLCEAMYESWYELSTLKYFGNIGWQRTAQGVPKARYYGKPTSEDEAKVIDVLQKWVANEKQYLADRAEAVEIELLTLDFPAAGELRQWIAQLRWEIMMTGFLAFLRLGSTVSGSRALSEPLERFYLAAVNAALKAKEEVINRFAVRRLFRWPANEFPGLTALPRLRVLDIPTVPLQEVGAFIQAAGEFLQVANTDDANALRRISGFLPEIEELEEEEAQPKPETGGAEEEEAEAAELKERQARLPKGDPLPPAEPEITQEDIEAEVALLRRVQRALDELAREEET